LTLSRILLTTSLAAGVLAIIDAIWSAVWTMGGWLVVCLTCLVAAQIAERVEK
jgi:hypothetical protein